MHFLGARCAVLAEKIPRYLFATAHLIRRSALSCRRRLQASRQLSFSLCSRLRTEIERRAHHLLAKIPESIDTLKRTSVEIAVEDLAVVKICPRVLD
jgi:hypothetical protein